MAQTTVPQGYYWLKELVPQAQWDEPTRTIKLAGGLSIPLSSTLAVGGKAYVTPQQLSAWYATYQPESSITAENVQKQAGVFQQLYEPLMQASRERRDFEARKRMEQAEALRRRAEASFDVARQNLQQQETSSWNAIMRSAIARGLGTSPLASYEQRKVVESYAPQFRQLETQRAAQLADIMSQAALAVEELALQGREEEAQFASQIAQAAYNALQQEESRRRQLIQGLAQRFAEMAREEAEARAEEEKLAWEKEKTYLPYQYPTANALLPYTMGLTPYQQASLNVAARRAAQTGGLTAWQQYQIEKEQREAEAQRAADLTADKDAIIKRIRSGASREQVLQDINDGLLAGRFDENYARELRSIVDQLAPSKPKQSFLDTLKKGLSAYGKWIIQGPADIW